MKTDPTPISNTLAREAIVLGALVITILAGAALGTSGRDQNPEARLVELVELMADAHGGRDALRQVHALRTEGSIATTQGEEGTSRA